MRYLQLLLLEHAGFWGVEDVVSELRLAVYVDGRRGLAGQEGVVDLPGTLWELERSRGEIERVDYGATPALIISGNVCADGRVIR